ncbi:uncharacterized protein PHACADRAFT_198934 [Phanerochaete carnosa HHB-10118-sp]|uniref:Uncharacterized protein n=1 Tax=Phanerochaete carnosa (strain HHB-10118-sp) TaxID=650164 RepID=K5W1B6_PHACS|nr:uncharacterized protein PHACADRAFT_198934 [Phanerochaete carnosa HHB-10118-sp]EKM52885.1 hypothetical protein PHACADRAFT_198934 [Phanerochaete carnosa HHB-10118-sp]
MQWTCHTRSSFWIALPIPSNVAPQWDSAEHATLDLYPLPRAALLSRTSPSETQPCARPPARPPVRRPPFWPGTSLGRVPTSALRLAWAQPWAMTPSARRGASMSLTEDEKQHVICGAARMPDGQGGAVRAGRLSRVDSGSRSVFARGRGD